MNRTIYYYPIKILDKQILKTHSIFTFLDVKVINNELRVYCLVDPDSKLEENLEIFIFGTGKYFNEKTLSPSVIDNGKYPIIFPWEYKGSHIQIKDNKEFVWHIFIKLNIGEIENE